MYQADKDAGKQVEKSMKRKILFIIPAMRGGGAEKVLLDILENFDYSKYDVSLLMKVMDEKHTASIPAEVKKLWLWSRQSIWSHRIRRMTQLLGCYVPYYRHICRKRVDKTLKDERYDTIVSFMEGEAVCIHNLISERAQKNASWVHIDFQRKHWSSLWFREGEERRVYSKMDKVVFVSNDALRGFVKELDYTKDNMDVIPNLIDKAKIKRLSGRDPIAKTHSHTLCMVGRLNSQKRYDRAIDAVALLKGDGYDIELWIVGEGELKQSLEQRCISHGVEDIVKFWGFVNPPYGIVKDADIFLSTSDSEGYPLALCEALCLGKPCICTAVTGPIEILEDSKYGLLCEETVESIYASIKKLIDHPELRTELGTMAQKRSEMFDIKETMSRIYSVI